MYLNWIHLHSTQYILRVQGHEVSYNTLKVDVLLNSAISKLNEDSVELKDGRKIPTKTLIWTAGVRACCLNDNLLLKKEERVG